VLVTTVGLAGDIARHLQNPGSLENDFLSGWHLVLYGGVASVGAFIGLGAIRRGPSYVGAVGSGAIGFVMLAMGGVADATWHEIFGAEAAVEALVSPPHLLVFAGLAFLLTAPVVVLWQRPGFRFGLVPSVAVVASVVSAVLVTSLFTGYLSPLSGGLSLQAGYVEPLVGESIEDYDTVRGLGIVVWTSAVLAAAFSVTLMRFRLVPGVVFAGFLVLAVPPLVVAEGSATRPLTVGFVVAGLVLEVVTRLLARPVLGRFGVCVAVAAMASSLWAATFLSLSLDGRLGWEEALWGGAIVLSGLIAAAVAGLVGLSVPRPSRPS
ncbi:MAG: hypothetical protein ABI239_00730, partial [Aquihabitans sp.]